MNNYELETKCVVQDVERLTLASSEVELFAFQLELDACELPFEVKQSILDQGETLVELQQLLRHAVDTILDNT